MTTAIARPGLLIVDTQWLGENGCEYRSKIFSPAQPGKFGSEGFWTMAGEACAVTLLRHVVSRSTTVQDIAYKLRKEAEGKVDTAFLWVRPSRVHYIDTFGCATDYTEWIAIGSGAGYARVYLECERWPLDDDEILGRMAMKAAVKLDPHTGGEIEVRRIGDA